MTRRARGFVLLEAMVACLIVALLLGAAFVVIGQSARATARAEETRAALMVARSELAAAGVAGPLPYGASDGGDARFRWRIVAERAGDGAGRAGPVARVTVTVGTEARPAIVTLSTLKIAGL